MLRQGNSKLGLDYWTFSLPAIKTCPGSTKFCKSLCYATNGFYNMPNVQTALDDAHKATRKTNFTDLVTADIAWHNVRKVRIHASGDFYSAAYVEKWVEIATKARSTVFLVYTRSWRVAAILPALRKLAKLPNVHLWLSADADSGKPVRMESSAGIAYLMKDDRDTPAYPVGLVFRDGPKTEMKYAPSGDFVCPAEQGVDRPKMKMTCSRCNFCIGSVRPRRAKTKAARRSRLSLATV